MSLIIQKFKKSIQQDQIIKSGTKLLVAVSGGLDSMCLLSLIEQLEINDHDVFVTYVNHFQRSESSEEEETVKNYVLTHGLNFIAGEISEIDHKEMSETQLRIRRYDSLEIIAQRYDINLILTAHHLDDLKETYLMQIIRSGTVLGVNGILKISRRNGFTYYRPLLDFSKKELLQHALDNHLDFYEDETNLGDDTIRNQFRHHLFNGNILSTQEERNFLKFCLKFSEIKSDAFVYYEQLIKKYMVSPMILSTNILTDQNFSSTSFLSYFFSRNNFTKINYHQIDQCSKLLNNQLKPQGLIKINKSFNFFKDYNSFGIKKLISDDPIQAPIFSFNKWYLVGDSEVGVFDLKEVNNQNWSKKYLLNLDYSDPPLEWRYRHSGDEIVINGHTKKLRRLMIDEKIPNEKRDHLLVLASGSKIIYLENFGYSGLFKTNKTDRITSVVLIR